MVEKHPRSLSHHPLSTLRRRRHRRRRHRRRRARRHRALFHLSLFFPSSRSRPRSHDTHLRPMVRTVFHDSKRLRSFELYERVNARGCTILRAYTRRVHGEGKRQQREIQVEHTYMCTCTRTNSCRKKGKVKRSIDDFGRSWGEGAKGIGKKNLARELSTTPCRHRRSPGHSRLVDPNVITHLLLAVTPPFSCIVSSVYSRPVFFGQSCCASLLLAYISYVAVFLH